MSEMVERSARAIAEAPATHAHWGGMQVSYDDLFAKQQDALVSLARLVLLAALDPKDEALVERVAKRMILARNQGDDRLAGFVLTWDREPALADARAAIAALKAVAQGES